MINSVDTTSTQPIRSNDVEPETKQLAERRAEENHKLVVSALQERHQQRVEAAIDAQVRFEMERTTEAAAPLTHVQNAYNEF